MIVIFLLIPLSIVIAAGFLAAFIWAVRTGQYEDTCTPAMRLLLDEAKLKNPETGVILAYEAFFLGNARLIKPGEPATLRVTLAKEEMARGDELIPAPPPEIITYSPRRPEREVAARVMSIYGGVQEGGATSVVSLTQGKNDGLEVGHVVALFRKRVSVNIDDNGIRSETPVPEERYGLAFVFRVFDGVAYALVVESSKSVIIGDSARNP